MPRFRRPWFSPALLAFWTAVALASIGCDAEMTTPAGPPTFADLTAKLRQTCKTCHTIDGLGGGLFFGESPSDDDQAYKVLLTGMKGSLCRDCAPARVTAGHPEQSLLYVKVKGRVDKNVDVLCGGSMPPSESAALDDAGIEMIKAWILAGAKR